MAKKFFSDKNTSISVLKEELIDFLEKRDWKKFHLPKNLSMSIAIEAAELMEHFQWLTTEEASKKKSKNLKQIKEEIADIILFCLSLCVYYNIDVSKIIIDKIERNKKKYPISRYYGRY